MFGGKKKISELEADLAKAREEAAAAAKAKAANAQAAQKKVEQLQEQVKELMAKDRERLAAERKKSLEERRARLEESKKPQEAKEVKEHIVAEGETLSHVALKYYGSATPPYWQHLLEHNKEVLKGNERNVRTGMKLVIPELPEELKK